MPVDLPGVRFAGDPARGPGRLQVHRRRPQVPRAARRVDPAFRRPARHGHRRPGREARRAAGERRRRSTRRRICTRWRRGSCWPSANAVRREDTRPASSRPSRRASRPPCRGCCSRSVFRRWASRRRARWPNSLAISSPDARPTPRQIEETPDVGPVVSQEIAKFFAKPAGARRGRQAHRRAMSVAGRSTSRKRRGCCRSRASPS